MAKARFGGVMVGPNPTDRAKPGTKRSLLVEADGGPLAVVIAGANVPGYQAARKDIGSRCRRTSKSQGTGTTSVFRQRLR